MSYYLFYKYTIYSILVARSAVTNAIKHRMEIDCPINYKVALLKEDIDNGHIIFLVVMINVLGC